MLKSLCGSSEQVSNSLPKVRFGSQRWVYNKTEFLRELQLLELAGEGQRAQLWSLLCPERELNFFRAVFLGCVGVELCSKSLELFPVPVQAAQEHRNPNPSILLPAAAWNQSGNLGSAQAARVTPTPLGAETHLTNWMGWMHLNLKIHGAFLF